MNVEAIAQPVIQSTPSVNEPLAQPQRRPEPVEAKAQPEPTTASEAEPDPEALGQVLDGVNKLMASDGSHIQFALHEGTGKMMVEVIDDVTKEIIKTFPSKELLDLASKIGELVGTLLDEKG